MSRDIFPQPRVLRAPSNLALSTAREGPRSRRVQGRFGVMTLGRQTEGCWDPHFKTSRAVPAIAGQERAGRGMGREPFAPTAAGSFPVPPAARPSHPPRLFAVFLDTLEVFAKLWALGVQPKAFA